MKKTILLFFTGLLLVCQASAKKPGFALWQLSPQGPSQMNSYVFVTDKGRVVVLDGGTADDAPFLRGFIAALGNHVDKWSCIVSNFYIKSQPQVLHLLIIRVLHSYVPRKKRCSAN